MNSNDLNLVLCSHELHTGCRLGVKRSRVYNVGHSFETFCCRSFVACPFELKVFEFGDDMTGAFLKLEKPHLHDITRNGDRYFCSI